MARYERPDYRAEYVEKAKPSANKPKFRRKVPPGCTSIYRISQWDGRHSAYHGIYRDEAEAYRVADGVWMKAQGPWDRNSTVLPNKRVNVEHKAAIEVDGRYYIVNLDPIEFTESPPQNKAALLRAPEEQASC